MALIKCPECGKEISDKAAACPNCGTPIADKKIPVHFERKRAFGGSANTGTVYVDGNAVGSAGNGASFDVMLTPGMHSVQIEAKLHGIAGNGSARGTTIEVPADAKRVEVEIKLKNDMTSMFLTGGMAIVVGDVRVIR